MVLAMTDSIWPITIGDARAAQARIRADVAPTPLRHYAALDRAIGHGVKVLVKHENHQPTNAFKVRNALSALTALDDQQRRRGVVGASRGNHGLGLAWAGRRLGIPVTICVPTGNNPEKNESMRDLGATVIEEGRDYDESVEVANRLVERDGFTLVHSTNNRDIIAGAATITLEILDQASSLDAMVVAVGGGSQAVGALVATRALRPGVAVYGVQAARAPAIHDGWQAGVPLTRESADTFADGLATRNCYDYTFAALRAGLTDFVTATEAEIADALRLCIRTTHNLVEGAGAAGLAGLRRLGAGLAGKTVAVILSGANIDEATLRRVIAGEI